MNATKAIFAGIGIYLIYQWYSTHAPAAAPPTPQTKAPTGSPAPPAPVAPVVNATTRSLLMQYVGGNANFTQSFHGWNAAYQTVRTPGATLPAPEDVGQGDGNRLLTVDEYLLSIARANLAGLRGLVANRRRA
jgi:hypothetical protein